MKPELDPIDELDDFGKGLLTLLLLLSEGRRRRFRVMDNIFDMQKLEGPDYPLDFFCPDKDTTEE